MKLFTLLGLIIFCANMAYSQHQDLGEKPKIWQSDIRSNSDSTTLLSAFKSGTVNGHFRFYLSSISNKGNLTDYHANALGGGLRYETGDFKGFTLGVSGFYIFNAGSSDLSIKDITSGQANRYEIGLFDLTNSSDLNEINRLEEFFVKYQKDRLKITLGRQLLNTPFINLQDGRMRPSATEGLWIESSISKKHQINLGWLYAMAPRSTSKWYDVGESIGLYPVGVSADGVKSNYAGNTQTNGILLANYQAKLVTPLTINVWNMYLENIMNTTMVQADWTRSLNRGKIYASVQGSAQGIIGDGGNTDIEKAYYTSDKSVFTFGAQTGWKNVNWDYSLNFNRITSGGRFLMPREWGRDYFFTFMPRERNEGFGDVTALMAKASYTLKLRSSIQIAAGSFTLPDVKNYALNKYGLPSYYQLNIDLRHKFSGFMKGFEAQVLWVSKFNNGETYDNPKYIIHKVDMNLLNIVMNFRF